MSPKRPKILEVIVSSLEDAIEAQEGGADRLEVVRDLAQGGFTPDSALVERIVSAVGIPVRAMVRENASMSVLDAKELDTLCRRAGEFAESGLDGVVAGFVVDSELDLPAMRAIAEAAPGLKITFHRAFDVLANPLRAISTLKTLSQVDRILTTGGPGSWPARKLRLHHWQRYAWPEITILAGAGLCEPVISDLGRDGQIREIHIGRAARMPQEAGGAVSRVRVARLKGQAT